MQVLFHQGFLLFRWRQCHNYTNTTTFNAATTRYIEFQPQTTSHVYFACYVHGIQMGGAITSQDLIVTLPSSQQ